MLGPVLADPALRRVELAFGAFAAAEAAVWLAILVYAYQQGGVVEAGLVAFAQLVPAALLAPLAALAADRLRRDAVLAGGHALQALCMALVAAAVGLELHRLWVYAASALVCVAVTCTRPALGALLPALTRSPEELVASNAASGVLENLGGLLGPLAAAGLLLRGGAAPVFAAAAALMAGAALAVARMDLDPERAARPLQPEPGSVLTRLLGGADLLRRDVDVRLLLACVAAPSVLLGALEVLLVAVATSLLGRGEHVAGYLTAALGVGGLLGASVTVLLIGRHRLAAALCVGGLGASLPILGIPWTTSLPLVVLLLLLSGAGQSFGDVVGLTLLQRVAPGHLRARVLGMLESLHTASLAAGALLVSGVSAWLGVPGALIVFGLLVPAVLAVSLRRLLAIDAAAAAPPAEILAALRGDPILGLLAAPVIESLAARALPVTLPAGHEVMRQGEVGDRYYRILEGELEVRIDGRPVRCLGPGESFGEIALLRAIPRTATVVADTAARLVALDRESFLESVTGNPASRARALYTARRLLDA